MIAPALSTRLAASVKTACTLIIPTARMTAKNARYPMNTDLEARIAEVLAAHEDHVFVHGKKGEKPDWSTRCVCGVELFSSDHSPEHTMRPGQSYATSAFAAHQAAMLAPLIREAQAEAWDKGCGAGDAYGYQRNEFEHQYIDQLDTPANPYRSAS